MRDEGMSGIEIAEKIHNDFFVVWPPHCTVLNKNWQDSKRSCMEKNY